MYIIMPPEDILEDGEDEPLERCFRAGYRSVAGTKDQCIAFACAEDGWGVEAVYIKVWTLTDTGVEPKTSRLPSKSEVDEIVNYWPADNEAKCKCCVTSGAHNCVLIESFTKCISGVFTFTIGESWMRGSTATAISHLA